MFAIGTSSYIRHETVLELERPTMATTKNQELRASVANVAIVPNSCPKLGIFLEF